MADKKISQLVEDTTITGSEDLVVAQGGANNKMKSSLFLDTDNHTDGTVNKVFTAVEKTKLAGIEANANITDSVNVGSSIHGTTAKTTPVDADTIAIIDSENSNVLSRITWANNKAALKTYFDGIYQDELGYTPEDEANKVSSISGTSTDIEYPTAKLLYDQLLLKANLTGATFSGAISATNLSGTNTGDQTATTLPTTPTGNFGSTNAQAGFQELQGDIDTINTTLSGLTSSVVLKGTWDASSGIFPGGGVGKAGWSYIVSVGGTVDGVTFNINDRILAIVDNASTTTYANNWFKLDYTDQVLSVNGETGAVVLDTGDIASVLNNRYVTDSDLTNLSNLSGTNTGDQTNITGNAGTATALQTARSIYGNSFDGTADLTQVIASTFGGTGNGFTKFTGPTGTEKIFTLPDSNATIATNLNNLSLFASTTSAQLAGVISDETGTGLVVFSDSPTLTGTVSTQRVTASGIGMTSGQYSIETSAGLNAPSATVLQGPGTVSTTGGVSSVTGVGTEFTAWFKSSDTITVNGESVVINSITSDTVMTTNTAWVGTNTSQPYTITSQNIGIRILPNGLMKTMGAPNRQTANIMSFLQVGDASSSLVYTYNSPTNMTLIPLQAAPTIAFGANATGSNGVNGLNASTRIAATNVGNISTLFGGAYTTQIISGASGTISNFVGFNTLTLSQSATQTTTNLIGLRTQTLQSNSAPIVNAAGFVIGALPTSPAPSGNSVLLLVGTATIPTGTFGAYLTSVSTSVNYFQRKVGIGTTTPDTNSMLDVVGVVKSFGYSPAYASKTADYTLANTDSTIDFTSGGVLTATLPTAVGFTGRIFNIKNTGATSVAIATTSSQTVDGNASGVLILVIGESITVQSNGSNWIII